MELYRLLLKILMWVLIIGFSCNFVMQTISYSFYKGAKQINNILLLPERIQFTSTLTGYGYHLDAVSDKILLFFGGSNDISYNSVAKYAGNFSLPFLSADYHGTQDSKGKMNLDTMKKTATELYDWAAKHYPNRKIVVAGHSYGSGMAAYLASARLCDTLILLAAYTDLADLYNKIIPIFWGPLKVFLSNNIQICEYAKNTKCQVYIIGSTADKTLGVKLQEKVSKCYEKIIPFAVFSAKQCITSLPQLRSPAKARDC